MTDRVEVSGEAPRPADKTAGGEPSHQFGLTAAMALIVGSIFWTYWAPFFLAAGALLLGIPVYLAQRSHLTAPDPVPPYR